MKWGTCLAGLLMLATIGCGGTVINVDARFGKQQIAEIQTSIDEWAEASDSDLTSEIRSNIPTKFTWADYILDEESTFVIYKINTGDSIYNQLVRSIKYGYLIRNDQYGICGCADKSGMKYGSKITIVADATCLWFGATVKHEIGHAFGLRHGDGRLMEDSPNIPNCIDQETLRNFCKINNCGPKARPTCG